MSILLLSVVTSLALTSSSSQDLVNERFIAARGYYEALWKINCPKEVSEVNIDESTLKLCLILDTRFEDQQTCHWWYALDTKPKISTELSLLFSQCTATKKAQ